MMSPSEVADFLAGSTFGAEADLGSADRRIPMPAGNTWCSLEDATSSHCGIMVDPQCEFNMFGGELQTKVCSSEEELLSTIFNVMETVLPERSLPTSRGTTHIHMRIPQLLERPDVIKHLIEYGQKHDHKILQKVHIIDEPDYSIYPTDIQEKYYRWHYDCWKNVYQYPYHPLAVKRMQQSDLTSIDSMVNALHGGVAKKGGFQERDKCRPAINYHHLPTLGTIEFRCFNATINKEHYTNIINFPREYITAALLDKKEPEDIFDSRVYADNSIWGSTSEDNQVRENKANTCIYINESVGFRKQVIRYISIMLISKKLTIKDLNYPQYWIDKGFQ